MPVELAVPQNPLAGFGEDLDVGEQLAVEFGGLLQFRDCGLQPASFSVIVLRSFSEIFSFFAEGYAV